MNNQLLDQEVQDYIQKNKNGDSHQLLLKKSPFLAVSMQEIVQQIKGRKVAERKFPFLLKEEILFPPQLNLEQCSSEITAQYKKKLSQGKRMVDLTSGFGIDAWFLSENYEETILCEQNEELLSLVQHNWIICNKKATFFLGNLTEFLQQNSLHFDLIYLDPARRDNNKRKVFLLEELSPNIIELQDDLLGISAKVMIKLSPLIDISYLIKTIKNICEIHIVAVKNEVKEIVLILNSASTTENIKLITTNLESQEPDCEINWNDIPQAKVEYSEPLQYLYIPNNSLLKSGAFHWISGKFNLKKIHPNTHLYTSDILREDFPGRVIKVNKIEPKTLKKGMQFNIIAKNYPLRPEEIKKKYQLKDGGEEYIIFTQSLKGKIVLCTNLIN